MIACKPDLRVRHVELDASTEPTTARVRHVELDASTEPTTALLPPPRLPFRSCAVPSPPTPRLAPPREGVFEGKEGVLEPTLKEGVFEAMGSAVVTSCSGLHSANSLKRSTSRSKLTEPLLSRNRTASEATARTVRSAPGPPPPLPPPPPPPLLAPPPPTWTPDAPVLGWAGSARGSASMSSSARASSDVMVSVLVGTISTSSE